MFCKTLHQFIGLFIHNIGSTSYCRQMPPYSLTEPVQVISLLTGGKVVFPDGKGMQAHVGNIIECSWDARTNAWSYMRERHDKSTPNAWRVYEKVLQSIKDNITPAVLLEEIAQVMASSELYVTERDEQQAKERERREQQAKERARQHAQEKGKQQVKEQTLHQAADATALTSCRPDTHSNLLTSNVSK